MKLSAIGGRRVAVIGTLTHERVLSRWLERVGAEVTRTLDDDEVSVVILGQASSEEVASASALGVPMIEENELIALVNRAASQGA